LNSGSYDELGIIGKIIDLRKLSVLEIIIGMALDHGKFSPSSLLNRVNFIFKLFRHYFIKRVFKLYKFWNRGIVSD
jgi:hypothetical protein